MQTNKMATDDRGARILQDINAAFKKDPLIDEYDVIPVLEPKHNKSPLILIEHKLGLEVWSVKILFEYSYRTLFTWRKKELSSKQLGAGDLVGLSRAVILVNPECATAWNIRKELIQSGDLGIVDDLKLGSLVFTKHPKSPETFCHRKWLFSRLLKEQRPATVALLENSVNGEIQNGEISVEAINVDIISNTDNHVTNQHRFQPHTNGSDVFAQELRVCERAASRYPSNYNAWSHRIWVVQTCYKSEVPVLLSELAETERWVSLHVSDHSGCHYRQFLLSELIRRKPMLQTELSLLVKDFVQAEMKFITNLLGQFEAHEALWCHRKFVFYALNKLSDSVTSNKLKTSGPTENGDVEEKDSEREFSLKKTRLENDSHIASVKEVDTVCHTELLSTDLQQQHLADRYVEWIKKVFL